MKKKLQIITVSHILCFTKDGIRSDPAISLITKPNCKSPQTIIKYPIMTNALPTYRNKVRLDIRGFSRPGLVLGHTETYGEYQSRTGD
jgi:hypothetical protein